MKWLYDVVCNNYANFEGRAGRQEYWISTILAGLFLGLSAVGDMLIVWVLYVSGDGAVATILGGLYGMVAAVSFVYLGIGGFMLGMVLALAVPILAVTVRRLHDTDRSGWWALVGLVPVVGGVVMFIFMVLAGSKEANEYGEKARVLWE